MKPLRITCRTMRRYFVNGKGYNSLAVAIRALARSELMSMVYLPRDSKFPYRELVVNPEFAHDITADEVAHTRRLGVPTVCPSCRIDRKDDGTYEFRYPHCKRKGAEWIESRCIQLKREYESSGGVR